MGAKKTKAKERGFLGYFPKICKANGAAARTDVHREMEKMLSFAIASLVQNSNIILSDYATKEDTVKPKIVQAALETMLHGALKSKAIGAGVAAELARVQKAKKIAAKAKAKGAEAGAEAGEAAEEVAT